MHHFELQCQNRGLGRGYHDLGFGGLLWVGWDKINFTAYKWDLFMGGKPFSLYFSSCCPRITCLLAWQPKHRSQGVLRSVAQQQAGWVSAEGLIYQPVERTYSLFENGGCNSMEIVHSNSPQMPPKFSPRYFLGPFGIVGRVWGATPAYNSCGWTVVHCTRTSFIGWRTQMMKSDPLWSWAGPPVVLLWVLSGCTT